MHKFGISPSSYDRTTRISCALHPQTLTKKLDKINETIVFKDWTRNRAGQWSLTEGNKTRWTLIYKFLEIYSLPKLNQEEAENINRPITATEIEAVIRTPGTHKPWTRRFHRWILPIIQRKTNTYPSETSPKNSRRGKTSKLLLWCQCYCNSKIR